MKNPVDPNLLLLEAVAEALQPLLDELVLVGGCVIGLLITDRAQPLIRATDDVDLITEIATYADYVQLGQKLREMGFTEGDITCRWIKASLQIDIIPKDEKILGSQIAGTNLQPRLRLSTFCKMVEKFVMRQHRYSSRQSWCRFINGVKATISIMTWKTSLRSLIVASR